MFYFILRYHRLFILLQNTLKSIFEYQSYLVLFQTCQILIKNDKNDLFYLDVFQFSILFKKYHKYFVSFESFSKF